MTERERERGREKTENKMEEWPCMEKGRLLWRRRRNGRWRGVHGNVSSFLFSSGGGATADQWLDLGGVGGGGGPGTKHPFDREPHRSPVEMLGSLVEPCQTHLLPAFQEPHQAQQQSASSQSLPHRTPTPATPPRTCLRAPHTG